MVFLAQVHAGGQLTRGQVDGRALQGAFLEQATTFNIGVGRLRSLSRGVSRVVREIGSVKSQLWAKDKSFVQLPAGMLFMNRLQFGFYSVLARLDVPVLVVAKAMSFSTIRTERSPS